MTLFFNLSSHALLSVHSIISFSVTLLCEVEVCVCVCAHVQAILARCATRMPGTTERHEKERERSISPPKTLCLLTMQVYG